jgi:hypothetical protein
MIGISHYGVKFIKRERDYNSDQLVLIEQFNLLEIREITLPKDNTIYLTVGQADKKIILYSHRVTLYFIVDDI